MTSREFNLAALALAAWQEGADSSVEVMICIARTIWNLAQRDEIGVLDAIDRHRNLHGLLDEDNHPNPDERDPKFTKLLQRIDEIGSQYSDDLTNGAIYYADLSSPSQIAKEIAKNESCAVAGRLHFFK